MTANTPGLRHFPPPEIRDYSVLKLDPETGDQTHRLQRAIDACEAQGGGTIELGRGRFETGTLHLRSGVELRLSAGSVLAASPDRSRFPLLEPRVIRFTGDDHGVRALIVGQGIRNASVTGQGTIHATAEGFLCFPLSDQSRPRGIHLEDCENIRIEGIRLRDSCFWMLLVLGCRNVVLSDLSIWNHAMPNSDGIDIVGSSNVRIERCVIDTDDDGICLKSGTTRATRGIHVSHCRVFTHCNALKVGTETNSDVEDLVFEDCVLGASTHAGGLHFGSPHGLSGICLGMVDGGSLRRATFRRIIMTDFESPIFAKIGTRNRPIPGGGTAEISESDSPGISGLHIEDVECRNTGSFGSMFMGLPGRPLEDIVLRRFHAEATRSCEASFRGGDLEARAAEYPDCRHFGPSPARGLFSAHIRGLVRQDCHFICCGLDPRPEVVVADCD